MPQLSMGFECRLFPKTPAEEGILAERRARDHRGRCGQRVQTRLWECWKGGFAGRRRTSAKA